MTSTHRIRSLASIALCLLSALGAWGQFAHYNHGTRAALDQADSLLKAGEYWLVEYASLDFRVTECSHNMDMQYGLQHLYLQSGCIVFDSDPTYDDLWAHNLRVLHVVDSLKGSDLEHTYVAIREACKRDFCGGKEDLFDMWSPAVMGSFWSLHFRPGEDTLNGSHRCATDNTLTPLLEQVADVEIYISVVQLKQWTDASKTAPMRRALALRRQLLKGGNAPERILLKPIEGLEPPFEFLGLMTMEAQQQTVFCDLRWRSPAR